MRRTRKVRSVKRSKHKSKGGVKSTFKTPRPYHKTSGTPSALRLRETILSKKSPEKKYTGNLSGQQAKMLNKQRLEKIKRMQEINKRTLKEKKKTINDVLDMKRQLF